MTQPALPQGPQVTIGVDTHKDLHVAAARDQLGRRLATIQIPTTSAGYAQLLAWADGLGEVRAWGVEGTGSYGAGLARFLAAHAQQVLEVNRPDRATRRRRGKSDPVDADAAARAVQAGEATGIPKTADGSVEMLRALRAARQTAVKARTQAINALKALLVTAPAELRESLTGLPTRRLIHTDRRPDPGRADHPDSGHHAGLAQPRPALPAPGHRDRPAHRAAGDAHHPPRPQAARAAGRRARQRRRTADRRRRQPHPPHQRRRLRGAVRRLPSPGVLWQDHPASAQPRRRPASQCRAPPDRAGAAALAPAHPRLRRPPHRPGQDQQGNHAVPQALWMGPKPGPPAQGQPAWAAGVCLREAQAGRRVRPWGRALRGPWRRGRRP